MPLLLHIDSATDRCSVCVSKGSEILAFQEAEKAFQHGSQLTLFIQSCMQSAGHTLAELDGVAISKGPGSYTALRIGTATAKGICFALNKPLIAVSTLQSLASEAANQHPGATYYLPMIDARRMEVYTAVYNTENTELEVPSAMIIDEASFGTFVDEGAEMVLCGNGAEKCKEVLPSGKFVYLDILCDARWLVPLSLNAYQAKKFEDLAYFSPLYIKPPNITTPKKKL